jgi:HPt (histidine-containing phosphotransfer) domain-containing protein
VARLRDALEGDDLGTVRRLDHNLRGSGAGYGFARISQLGRALKQAAYEGDSVAARARVEELASHLDAIEPVRG